MIELEDLHLESLSDIDVSFFRARSRRGAPGSILIARYAGTYRFASAGNRDARFMYANGEAAIAAWSPSAVVIDLRKLHYTWGDMLERVFDVGARSYVDSRFPRAVVVGEHCEEPIRTLILGEYSKEPLSTIEWIFRDFEKALDYVDALLPTL